MKNQLITFKKHNLTILVIYLKNITFNFLKNFLLQKIQESPSFFKNIPILFNIEQLSSSLNWINIKRFILSIGLFIIGIIGCKDKHLKNIILKSGLFIFPELEKTISKKNNHYLFNMRDNTFAKPLYSPKKNQKSRLVNHIVRSGQRIYVSNTDLIITNNVSSGAELIAGGNIHIYGIMRGRVLAGANGDITRKIFCTKLFAELISIAGEYWTIEQIPIKFLGKSVEISLINHLMHIKSLN